MATEKEANIHCCASDPNFAVICSFLEQFSTQCGVAYPTFRELQDMLEDTHEVSQVLIDMHIKLLRKARKSFTADKWERALAKFCHTYSQQDGWELERFGYKKACLGVKVKLLKVLLETQFDVNAKFKSEVNKFGAKDLRLEPLGRDQSGFQYWCHFDKSSHVRVYREDVDEETWELVASDRSGLVQLIDSLSNGEGQLELSSILNEDSTSQEIEKPIIDTGQENKLVEDNDRHDGGGDDDDDDDDDDEEVEEEEEGEGEKLEDEEESQGANRVESNIKKSETVNIKLIENVSVPKPIEKDKTVSERVGFNHPIKTNATLTGVDLSIKSETKTNLTKPSDCYPSVPERPYIPERNDLLSQMSARFNGPREAEDLSLNPAKKVKQNDDNEDQPMMLVKKDVVVSEAIEEPISHVTGPGSGQDCEQGNTLEEPQFSEAIEEPINYVTGPGNGRDCNQENVREDPQFSEVIEEPIQYVTGVGYGVECDIGNPKAASSLVLEQEEPVFTEVIEEPVQYITGLGSGVECNIGNPKLFNSSTSPDSKLESSQKVIEFSETIEEPVQYIAGLGLGEECDVGNLKQCDTSEPSSSYSGSTMGIECSLNSLSLVTHELNFSDVIEEPVMFFRGPGYGQDCLTGNPEEIDESAEEKSPEKKPKLWSIDTICSSEKLLSESSGSSQKEPENLKGSSKAGEENGPLNCLDEDNRSSIKVSNGSNVCLKPSTDIKPILENIPMKDKPPDISNMDSLVHEGNNESILNINISENYLKLNDGDTNCLLRADKPNENNILETDKVSNNENLISEADFGQDKKKSSCEKQTTSSEGVTTSDDIYSNNFKSENKLNFGNQSSMEFDNNSISSVVSEEFVRGKSCATECRENSNTSEDCLVIRSSEKEISDIEKERLAQRKTRKSFDSLTRAEFGTESHSSIDSEKSDHIMNKIGTASKHYDISLSNDKNKPTNEEDSCKTNKTQSEKTGLGIGKNIEGPDTNIENTSSQLKVSNCSVVLGRITDSSKAPQNEIGENIEVPDIDIENGSSQLKVSNYSIALERSTDSSSLTKTPQNENEDDSLAPKQKSDTESENSSTSNNPAYSDKNDEKLKNVMLTNIIEMCLDNDTNSRDKAKSGLKGQLNAKFNDLFSAKNLLEPTVKIPGESNLISTISEKCSENSFTEEKLIIEDKSKSNYSDDKIVEETSGVVCKDKNSDSKDLSGSLASSSDSLSKYENGEFVNLEEPIEEISMKNPIKGRKSRTNSLNTEDEIEIPIKIRKTENIAARRLSRRNTRSVSQAEPSLEPESEKLDKQIESETTVKEESMRDDGESYEDKVEHLERGKDAEIAVKREKEMEETIKSKEEGDTVNELKKDNKEDEFNDSIQKEVDDIVGRLNDEEKEELQDSNKTCKSDNHNKGFSLLSFSLEPPAEDGPVLGKPPDFKTLQNRKRRNSHKLSRSEDDGEEEVVEEAGGKKPRLRAKARRSKGTLPPSRSPQQSGSSSEENQPEETLTPTPVKGKLPRSRGRPMKRRNVQGILKIKSTAGKQKNSEKIEQKSDDESLPKKEEQTQEDCDKEQKKKQSPLKRDNEKEDKKQIPLKKETKKGKANSKGSSKKVKKSTKVETEEDSGDEDKVEAKDLLKNDKNETGEDTDSKEKVKSKSVKKGRKSGKEPKTEEDTDNDGKEEAEVSNNTKSEVNENKNKCDIEEEDKSGEEKEIKPLPKKKGRPKKKKTLLGLMESDLIHSKPSGDDDGSRVRQSRRIAQIKIKEQAERRAIEEATIMSLQEIKKKTKEEKLSSAKKQKNKKPKIEKESEEEDASFKEPADDKKKGRKKKKKKLLTYDINKPWQSSSDSSSEEVEEEEEHFDEEYDEEDVTAHNIVSDHEFSPESDLEQEETDAAKPIRRARTAKKADEEVEESKEAEVSEDYPCKKCGKPDHPEWILLCDKCDSGYHASCLRRPTIMVIPEGDWFCPPCQHAKLVSKLKETLRTFERNTKRRENEELRKKRLAYVGISLANVLPTHEKQALGRSSVQSESSESFSSESESSDEDEEPVYQLRQRRAALQANYRFSDYDDLINSAIQDEMEAVKGAGNMGRGKDIANIVEAEKKVLNEDGEEVVNKQEEKVIEEEEQGENWRPPVVPKNTSLPSLRKKSKKLTDLDKHSDDDADSDEDFKGSSEEEEYSSSEGGDSDDSIGRRQPVRRSSRARTSRIDKEFINDDSESSDEPRKKKTRKIWASSSSESSDWGHRKRKANKTFSRIKTYRSGKQKKKSYFDSDSDKPKKPKTKRPKIRYGLSEDDEEPIRRTRGKKMSYLEVAGSDTEEEVLARSRKMIYEEEEEFVPEKEEVEVDEEEVEEPDEDDDETEIKKRQIDAEHDPVKKENLLSEKADQTKELNAPVLQIGNNVSAESKMKPVNDDEEDDEDDDDDDQVEEEEIEEEVEEEVEEEEEEEVDEGPIEEAKNLVREKVCVEEPTKIVQPPVKIGSGISVMKMPVPVPITGEAVAKSASTVAIKEEKKEEKEERKEPTPAIRLVPSAKLLDPNKRRPPDDGVIRGMLAGSGYYRAQPMQAPGRQPFRQRYPEQQRYLYPPVGGHQYYPGGAFYQPGEDLSVGGGYGEQMEGAGDEEGVFSGLVSYFSSQREDNLDS